MTKHTVVLRSTANEGSIAPETVRKTVEVKDQTELDEKAVDIQIDAEVEYGVHYLIDEVVTANG